MLERISADMTLARRSVESFLADEADELAQAWAQQGLDPASLPTALPKIVDKIIVRNFSPGRRVAWQEYGAGLFLEHLPTGSDPDGAV